MTETELFQKLGVVCDTLPGELNASTVDEFKNQLHTMFEQPEARQAEGVVYVWATKKEISRLKGGSNVVYIGKTKDSLCNRYLKYIPLVCKCWDRYDHIMRTYGPISIHYAKMDDLKTAETKLLAWYAEEHLEIPPANCKH